MRQVMMPLDLIRTVISRFALLMSTSRVMFVSRVLSVRITLPVMMPQDLTRRVREPSVLPTNTSRTMLVYRALREPRTLREMMLPYPIRTVISRFALLMIVCSTRLKLIDMWNVRVCV